MKNLLTCLLLLTAALAARAQSPLVPAAARAEQGASTYQAEYDSLTQRAARVRAQVEQRINESRSSFVALAGISRRTSSFARRPVRNSAATVPTGVRLVKKQVTKHKTHGADVAKVYYYATSGQLLLAELYQQHQLVRQRLYEYPLRGTRLDKKPFRSTEWVRGDYLRLRLRNAAETGGTNQQYYFTAARQPD